MPTVIDLSALTPDQGFIVIGDDPRNLAGESVSAAGDINGDGIDDFIVGAVRGTNGGLSAGEAYVIFGKVGATRPNIDFTTLTPADGFIIQGDNPGDNLGDSVSAAGDINGDGFDDIVIGAVGNGGTVYVIFGRSTPAFTNIDLSNFSAADGFRVRGDAVGSTVSSAGDVNGDGLDDIIIGAPFGVFGANSPGKAYVIYGKVGATRGDIDVTGLAAADGFTIVGVAVNNRLGTSVAGAGDVNGDGLADIIVGETDFNPTGTSGTGKATVIFGQSGTSRTTIIVASLAPSDGFIVIGDAAGDSAGDSVSAAGDINGDGIDDFIIGAFQGDNGGSGAGEAYVIYGQAGSTRANISLTTLAPVDGFIIQGDAPFDSAGTTVAFAGDFNHDGIDDILIGAPVGDDGGDGAGEVYVIFGRAGATRANIDLTALSSADGVIFQGDLAGDGLGGSAAFAGDVNGDGFTDIVLGAFGGDLGGLGAGQAYLIFGRSGAAVPTAGDDVITNPAGDNIFDGLGGIDTLDMSAFTVSITLNTITGTIVSSQSGTDTVINFEVFLLGSGNDSVLLGTLGFTVRAGAGNDQIIGGSGNDIVSGGAGSDSLDGGAGVDQITYDIATGAVYLELGAGFTLETTLQIGTVGAASIVASIDLVAQFENANGSAFGDRIYGSVVANIILSGAGDDIVYGEDGDDVVIGGAGSDILIGGSGVDLLDYSGAVGAIFADLAGSVTETALQTGIVGAGTAALSTDLLAQFENITGSLYGDRLYGDAGDNVLIGLAGDDIIYGGGGADTLLGGAGADRLIGEAGADTLTGGLGADRFIFSTALGTGVDTISDFNKGEGDQLFFLRSAFGLAPADPLTLVVNGAAVAAHSFLYNSTTGLLSYDADGAGGAAAVDVATIGAGVALTTGDLVLYG